MDTLAVAALILLALFVGLFALIRPWARGSDPLDVNVNGDWGSGDYGSECGGDGD
ncbi:hypothetical protein [Deinococcus aerophilus]|nr:hypothetical protein [Deinococcus aerophilus]